LCELLYQNGFILKEDITDNYDFDPRQTDYYSNAGRYLGLIKIVRDPETKQIGCYLTKQGKEIFQFNLFDRQKEFVKLILIHSAFKNTLIKYLNEGEMPDKDHIVEIMKQSNLFNVNSETTFRRRASTISGWLNWIIEQLDE